MMKREFMIFVAATALRRGVDRFGAEMNLPKSLRLQLNAHVSGIPVDG